MLREHELTNFGKLPNLSGLLVDIPRFHTVTKPLEAQQVSLRSIP